MAVQSDKGQAQTGLIAAASTLTVVDYFANAVSIVFTPPIMAVATLLLCAAVVGGDSAWRAVAGYLILAIGAPLAYLVWLVGRGEVSDLDVQRREERTRALLFSLAAMGAGGIMLWDVKAAPLLLAAGGIVWLQTALITGITLQWKISVHTTAMAAFWALLWVVFGEVALTALWLVPLVAWSRIHLNRHTPAQTVAGSLLGFFIAIIVLRLVLGA